MNRQRFLSVFYQKTRKKKRVKYRQKVHGIFSGHMNRQRFLSILYQRNPGNPEKKSEISARSSWNIFGSYESPTFSNQKCHRAYPKNPETKRVKYRQEVHEIFSGHMNRQRSLIKMS